MSQLTTFNTRAITAADRKGPLAEVIKRNGATTLTTIDMKLLSSLKIANTYPTIVVSILGSSRCGKSAFLNCIISYAKSKNILAFKSMSSKLSGAADVTVGMNYYVITDDDSKSNYMFIDVQGIGGALSSSDPTVLMFAYYISDVIIVNYRGQFETNTINILTPIVALVPKLIHKVDKPLLLFRIFDVDDDYDILQAAKNYQVVMQMRDDQYSGVRQCITELFKVTEPPILFTRKPDRATLIKFDKGNFDDALNATDDELNFEHVVVSIMQFLNQCKGKLEIVKYLNAIATNINNHSADINVSVFDMSSQITKDDVSVWLYGSTFLKDGQTAVESMIPKELSVPIVITTGLEDEWQKLIVPRKKLVNDTISKYKARFESAPKAIYTQGMEKLTSIAMPNLNEAVAKAEGLATTMCENTLTRYYSNISNIPLSDLTSNMEKLRERRLEIATALDGTNAAEHIKKKYQEKLDKLFSSIIKKVNMIVESRFKLVTGKLESITKKISSYKYENIITDSTLSTITSSYNDCVLAEYIAMLKACEIEHSQRDGIWGLSALDPHKYYRISDILVNITLEPEIYSCIASDHTTFEIKQYPSPSSQLIKSFTCKAVDYQKKGWLAVTNALVKFAAGFEAYRDTFEKMRLNNLQTYIDQQSPSDTNERIKFYRTVVRHNKVRMVEYHSHLANIAVYRYLREFKKIDIHKIYTEENFSKVIPMVVLKHLDEIKKYNKSELKLSAGDFIYTEMLTAWYRHLVETPVVEDID